MKFLFTHVTLEYFNFKKQNGLQNTKGFLSTSIASSEITTAKWLLDEMKVMHSWIFMIIDSFSGLFNLT